jgi:hypothetical protein
VASPVVVAAPVAAAEPKPAAPAAAAPREVAKEEVEREEQGGGGGVSLVNVIGIFAAGGLAGFAAFRGKQAEEAEAAYQAQLEARKHFWPHQSRICCPCLLRLIHACIHPFSSFSQTHWGARLRLASPRLASGGGAPTRPPTRLPTS